MIQSKGFEDDDIKMLVDDDDSYDSPDHVNVKNALNWLCTDREDGDVIFLHFSGHGTQIPSDNDDYEEDNLDEAIALEELFLMADDDLKQFFCKLPEGARATVIMDCCHSGSMLDGKDVMIEGAKDEDSEEQLAESDQLVSVLGGSRADESDAENRSLPLSTICNVMSQRLGTEVPPTGAGVNGAMAQVFGGSAGKLMLKFAMSQLAKQNGGGSGNDMMAMAGALMGGKSNSSGSGNPMAALSGLMGGGGGGGGGGSAMAALSGMMGGGAKTSSSNSSNPMSMLSGLMGGGGGSGGGSNPLSGLMGGGSQPPAPQPQQPSAPSSVSDLMSSLGLGGQMGGSAPTYNPNHDAIREDVVTLITGCQADETSADVRPRGGEPHGALTKTLADIQKADPEISNFKLVTAVRSSLSKGGFKQNPCLETTRDLAREVFICE